MITCSFCGNSFNDEDAVKGCSGCPMSKSCNKIKCPKCNYENVKVKKFGWFIKQKSKNNSYGVDTNGICKLSELKLGQRATITKVEVNEKSINKLGVFGIVPGEKIVVMQRFPAFIVRVGNTRVALDKDIAVDILVAY